MTIAGRTYGELISEVLEHQFSDAKYRPLVKKWLNDAQRRAVIESEFRTQEASESYSTTASDATYVLPTNFSRLIDLFNTETHEQLTPLDPREYDELPESTGRPYAYTVIGSELNLYATPDGVYPLKLRYWRLPADMVEDTDTPEIPVQYHELLIAFAMKKAFMREDDLPMAQQWDAIWREGVLKMRGEVQHDVFDGPRQVPGSFGNETPLVNTWWR